MSKKKSPHDPLAASPFKKDLSTLKAQMEAEEAAKQAEAARLEAAREARGDRPAAKRPAAASAPPRRPSTVDVWRPDLDQHLFNVAMSGITPLAPKQGGRVGAREGGAVTRGKKAPIEAQIKRAHAEGGPSIAAEWLPDGTVRAAQRGHEFALEALGRFASPQESLDLHGLDPSSARGRVAEFVRTRRARGARCVCVITGYGKSSPDGASVLLDAVVDELRRAPTANEIDAFASAPDDLGGRGAILVSLRA